LRKSRRARLPDLVKTETSIRLILVENLKTGPGSQRAQRLA